MVPQLWADVKYHVPTGIDFSPKASDFCFSASQYLSTEPRREFPGLFVWFGDEAAAVVVTEGDNVHFKQLHDGIFGGEARNVCQFWETRQGDASMEV